MLKFCELTEFIKCGIVATWNLIPQIWNLKHMNVHPPTRPHPHTHTQAPLPNKHSHTRTHTQTHTHRHARKLARTHACTHKPTQPRTQTHTRAPVGTKALTCVDIIH